MSTWFCRQEQALARSLAHIVQLTALPSGLMVSAVFQSQPAVRPAVRNHTTPFSQRFLVFVPSLSWQKDRFEYKDGSKRLFFAPCSSTWRLRKTSPRTPPQYFLWCFVQSLSWQMIVLHHHLN